MYLNGSLVRILKLPPLGTTLSFKPSHIFMMRCARITIAPNGLHLFLQTPMRLTLLIRNATTTWKGKRAISLMGGLVFTLVVGLHLLSGFLCLWPPILHPTSYWLPWTPFRADHSIIVQGPVVPPCCWSPSPSSGFPDACFWSSSRYCLACSSGRVARSEQARLSA
jgi:hypothetical protein